MIHQGQMQAGGQESGAAWAAANCVLDDKTVVFRVGNEEILRLFRSDIDFVPGNTGIFRVEGAPEPLFFLPADRGAFERDLRGEPTTADKIALASAAATPPLPAHTRGHAPPKSKVIAGLLAIFLGGLGIHKFYLGETTAGVVYLLFFWTFIPALIALVEGIIYLTMSDEAFANKYG